MQDARGAALHDDQLTVECAHISRWKSAVRRIGGDGSCASVGERDSSNVVGCTLGHHEYRRVERAAVGGKRVRRHGVAVEWNQGRRKPKKEAIERRCSPLV